MRIKMTRGCLAVGPYFMASGSGGGDPSGPPKPHDVVNPGNPNGNPWWKRLWAWLTKKFGK